MTLGEKLFVQRKKAGLSQEEVADKLDVSRQTVSKWETNQSTPELNKAKLLCQLYGVSYGYLIGNGPALGDLTSVESLSDEIDWTSAWSRKYPILSDYPAQEGIQEFQDGMLDLYQRYCKTYGCPEMDAFLVLKDILYRHYRTIKGLK